MIRNKALILKICMFRFTGFGKERSALHRNLQPRFALQQKRKSFWFPLQSGLIYFSQ